MKAKRTLAWTSYGRKIVFPPGMCLRPVFKNRIKRIRLSRRTTYSGSCQSNSRKSSGSPRQRLEVSGLVSVRTVVALKEWQEFHATCRHLRQPSETRTSGSVLVDFAEFYGTPHPLVRLLTRRAGSSRRSVLKSKFRCLRRLLYIESAKIHKIIKAELSSNHSLGRTRSSTRQDLKWATVPGKRRAPGTISGYSDPRLGLG